MNGPGSKHISPPYDPTGNGPVAGRLCLSPQAKSFDEKYRLEPAARAAIAEALKAVGLANEKALAAELLLDAPSTRLEQLILQLPPEGDWAWWLLYFLIVRAVRLADGKSQKT